jgi:hypothetical protein
VLGFNEEQITEIKASGATGEPVRQAAE